MCQAWPWSAFVLIIPTPAMAVCHRMQSFAPPQHALYSDSYQGGCWPLHALHLQWTVREALQEATTQLTVNQVLICAQHSRSGPMEVQKQSCAWYSLCRMQLERAVLSGAAFQVK